MAGTAASTPHNQRSSRPPAAGRRTLRMSGAWAAVGLLVVVAGLVGAGALRQLALPGGAASTGQAGAPSVGTPSEAPAPDFTARLLGGGEFTLAQQQGKPVLVLFTASWCFECIPEVDKLARLQEQFGPRGLQPLVLSVDPGDTEADFAALRQHTKGQNLLWGLDSSQKAALAYNIRATATRVLVDGHGQIVFRGVGPTSFETLRDRVAALLG